MMDTIRVYKLDKDDNRIDITEQCPFKITANDTDEKISKNFEMVVPDSTRLIVEYSYRITGKIGTQLEVINNASIKGYSTSIDEDDYVYNIRIQQSTAGAILVGVKIVKVDAENFGYKLEGAVFRLEKWNGTDYETVREFETDLNGVVNTGELSTNVAYRFIETSSPYGYDIDPTPYCFMIDGDAQTSTPIGFDGVVLNNGDTITIRNIKSRYELPETGGMGTTLIRIIGTLFVGGAILLMIKKRMDEE